MNKDLALLDQIEVVKQAGYKGRTDWTDELKKLPESRYAMRLSKNIFHI